MLSCFAKQLASLRATLAMGVALVFPATARTAQEHSNSSDFSRKAATPGHSLGWSKAYRRPDFIKGNQGDSCEMMFLFLLATRLFRCS